MFVLDNDGVICLFDIKSFYLLLLCKNCVSCYFMLLNGGIILIELFMLYVCDLIFLYEVLLIVYYVYVVMLMILYYFLFFFYYICICLYIRYMYEVF